MRRQAAARAPAQAPAKTAPKQAAPRPLLKKKEKQLLGRLLLRMRGLLRAKLLSQMKLLLRTRLPRLMMLLPQRRSLEPMKLPTQVRLLLLMMTTAKPLLSRKLSLRRRLLLKRKRQLSRLLLMPLKRKQQQLRRLPLKRKQRRLNKLLLMPQKRKRRLSKLLLMLLRKKRRLSRLLLKRLVPLKKQLLLQVPILLKRLLVQKKPWPRTRPLTTLPPQTPQKMAPRNVLRMSPRVRLQRETTRPPRGGSKAPGGRARTTTSRGVPGRSTGGHRGAAAVHVGVREGARCLEAQAVGGTCPRGGVHTGTCRHRHAGGPKARGPGRPGGRAPGTGQGPGALRPPRTRATPATFSCTRPGSTVITSTLVRIAWLWVTTWVPQMAAGGHVHHRHSRGCPGGCHRGDRPTAWGTGRRAGRRVDHLGGHRAGLPGVPRTVHGPP